MNRLYLQMLRRTSRFVFLRDPQPKTRYKYLPPLNYLLKVPSYPLLIHRPLGANTINGNRLAKDQFAGALTLFFHVLPGFTSAVSTSPGRTVYSKSARVQATAASPPPDILFLDTGGFFPEPNQSSPILGRRK